MKVREVIKLIEEGGWRHVRTRGSHRQFKHEFEPGLVTAPGHLNDELARGALNSVLAGIIHVGWRQGRADPWWGSQAGFLVGITLLHAAVRHLRPKSHQGIGLLGPPYQVMNNPG
jgi:predicted RNA binding protein YcfA (HicA-like mRNA interferase family)